MNAEDVLEAMMIASVTGALIGALLVLFGAVDTGAIVCTGSLIVVMVAFVCIVVDTARDTWRR